jgi:hypothetical protein
MIYKVQQFSVQLKMRLAVNGNQSSFEKLVLDIDEYRKCQLGSREISYKGNLYDVKSMSIKGDHAELIVINDVKEKILLEEIKDFLKKSNQSKKELPDQLQKFLSINYIAADEGREICIPSFSFNYSHQPDLDIYPDLSEIPSPPPKDC